MIYTLTLNPAVDVSMTVDRLDPEHKLHCSQPQYHAGGGGIEVAKAIHRLGLPPGLSTDFYGQIARFAKTRHIRMVFDAAGESLQKALDEGVFLIKPNFGELARLVGVDQLVTEQINKAAHELIGAGKCEVVVVSLGPRGALLVTADGHEFIQAPPVKKISTVGAGDSVVGGIVYALSQRKSYADMVRQGVACGTAATMNPGTELFQRADAERLLNWICQQHPQPPTS